MFPALCALTLITAYYPVVRRWVGDRFVALCALALLVFNSTFVYYSSEVKQYMGEALTALALTAVATLGRSWSIARQIVVFGALGSLSVWLSSAS